MKGDHIPKMSALAIGETVMLMPAEGDTLKTLHARVKKVARRWAPTEYFFRVHKGETSVIVTRCTKGETRKLSWLLKMKLGETVYFADDFSPDDYSRWYRKLTYWGDTKRRMCRAERHADGKIYLRLVCDGLVTWNEWLRENNMAEPVSQMDWVCAPWG